MAFSSLIFLPQWQNAHTLFHRIPDLQPEYFCPDRCGHNAVCVNEDLIIWGGYNERSHGSWYCAKDLLWAFNLDLNIWYSVLTRGESPSGRSGATSALNWPYWYILTGHTVNGNVNDVHRVNLLTLEWEKISGPGLPISCRDKSAVWGWNNRIYCFGGYGSYPDNCLWDKDQDTLILENDRGWNDQLTYFDCHTEEWIRPDCQGPKPLPRAAHAVVCIEDVLYLFGGRHQKDRLGDLHCLKMESLTWSGSLVCHGESPCGRSWHTFTKLSKTQILLFGGFSSNDIPMDDVWLLAVPSLSWSLLSKSTGNPLLWHTACINMMGDLLVFGGCKSNILDHTHMMETSDKVLLLKTQPFKLVRMCLHALHKHRKQMRSQWKLLPKLFSEWLELKSSLTEGKKGNHPSIHRENIQLVFGPSLHQLSAVVESEVQLLEDQH